MLRALFSEYFSKNGGVAGVMEFKIDSFANVIEKCFESGVAVALGGLIVAFVCRVRKEKISAGVMDSRSLLPNSSLNLVNKNS